MAQDNKQMKSILHRLSWSNNGKQLNNSIAEMLDLGQRCIDIYIASDDSDEEGKKLLQKFENIDHILLDMQQCIINALTPSSLAHKILEDRVKYKYKLSDCNCNSEIFKLREQYASERERRQNCNLRQRLLQIPVLDQNFDEERQMFILKIRACQARIKYLEKNLQYQKQDMCKAVEENQNLKQGLLQFSSSNNNDFKVNRIEYQKNLDMLEESLVYFSKRNGTLRQENRELKLKLNVNNSEKKNFEEELATNHEETVLVPELEKPYNNSTAKFFPGERKQLIRDKEKEASHDTIYRRKHLRTVSNTEIHENEFIFQEENCENLIIHDQKDHFAKSLCTEHNRKVMGNEEKED